MLGTEVEPIAPLPESLSGVGKLSDFGPVASLLKGYRAWVVCWSDSSRAPNLREFVVFTESALSEEVHVQRIVISINKFSPIRVYSQVNYMSCYANGEMTIPV